jgi:hypothetical protein
MGPSLPLREVCDLDGGKSRGHRMRVAALLLSLFAAVAMVGGWPGRPALAQGDGLQKKFADLYQAAVKEGEVIYYTDGRQDEAQRLSEYWKANFPGVNLRIVPKSSPALIAQIETERAAGQLPALQDPELRAAATGQCGPRWRISSIRNGGESWCWPIRKCPATR